MEENGNDVRLGHRVLRVHQPFLGPRGNLVPVELRVLRQASSQGSFTHRLAEQLPRRQTGRRIEKRRGEESLLGGGSLRLVLLDLHQGFRCSRARAHGCFLLRWIVVVLPFEMKSKADAIEHPTPIRMTIIIGLSSIVSGDR